MPIITVPTTDRVALYDMMAAMMLVAWATIRQVQDSDLETAAEKYKELREVMEIILGPP